MRWFEGQLSTRYVPTLDYTQFLIDGMLVDPATLSPPLKVTFYRQGRGALREVLGSAWVDGDGHAVWDEPLSVYMTGPLHRPRADHGVLVDPASGYDFVAELPLIFRNAPYLWAELTHLEQGS